MRSERIVRPGGIFPARARCCDLDGLLGNRGALPLRSKAGFERLFEHQAAVAQCRHVKGNDAAATVAVGLVSHHALAFVLSGGPQREGFEAKDAIVRHTFGVLRTHEFQGRVHHVDDARIFFLQFENAVNHRIARLPIEPEGFVQIGDGREEIEDDSAARNRPPLFHQVLYTIFRDARDDAGDLNL